MRKRLKNKPHPAKTVLRLETNFWVKILSDSPRTIGTQAEIRSVRRLLAQFIGKKIIEMPVGSCHKSFFDRESPAVLGETLIFT